MKQLKLCPFCGGRATIQQDTRYPRHGKRDTVKAFTPICTNCECLIYKADNVYFASEKKAIAAWNRRAQPENKPLTLDELGQLREAQIPIWMGRAKEWIFVASVADAPYAQVWYSNAKGFAQTVLYHHEKFYRSKPKEEHHEDD